MVYLFVQQNVMKKTTPLLFLLAFLLAACSDAQVSSENGEAGRISLIEPGQFYDHLQNGGEYYLVDVRTPQEYRGMHLDGAILINYYEPDFMRRMEAMDRDKPVYIYCATGGRSADACRALADNGFTRLYDMRGGIYRWKRENLPVNALD